jgi:leucyl/phenylalanyl-tRNA--protein transferase
MIELFQLDQSISFPAPTCALQEPSGLLAFGGDLSVERLLFAYSNGIFPWFSDGEPILWWSPEQRGILPLANFKRSKSLSKFIRKTPYNVTLNHAFEEVIESCASIPRGDSGTWITEEMIAAYQDLHIAGHAQSIEVWQNQQLIGGLYGVSVGKMFCGESMFHRSSNASKLAMYHLVSLLKEQGVEFIDCQLQNPHLASLGCITLSRDVFLNKLADAMKTSFHENLWLPRALS